MDENKKLMKLDITGKLALINGGIHGIGYAIAQIIVGESCRVIACSRYRDRISEALRSLDHSVNLACAYDFDALDRKIEAL